MSKISNYLRKFGVLKRKAPQMVILPQKQLSQILLDRAVVEAADFVTSHMEHALLFNTTDEIRGYGLDKSRPDGLLLEFGVFDGGSINFLADRLQSNGDSRPIYGFDAFLGLREDWVGTDHRAQTQFNRGGVLPPVRQNVRLCKGWIEDTLPTFLAEHGGPIAFIHIDTDTYSACKTILTLCRDRLTSGSVIVFDELLCYPGWRSGEFKALNEVFKPDEYSWLAFEHMRAALVFK